MSTAWTRSFYAMLTGKALFGGDSVIETLDAVRTRPSEAPRKRNAGIPRDLELICLKFLEKKLADRCPTVRAPADDLRRWAAGEPVSFSPDGSRIVSGSVDSMANVWDATPINRQVVLANWLPAVLKGEDHQLCRFT